METETIIISCLVFISIILTMVLWTLEKNLGALLSLGAAIGFCISLLILSPKPTAMDVYQGKTTLEYKVVDGVVVDSCVVYKKENP